MHGILLSRTGNVYHIHQPAEGFILEEDEQFAQFIDQMEKILPVNLCNLEKIF